MIETQEKAPAQTFNAAGTKPADDQTRASRAHPASDGYKIRRRGAPPQKWEAMPALATFSFVTCVAVLMLIVSIRALVWHRISRFLQTLLLLLVLFAGWQVITTNGPLSFESGLLFALCGLVGLLIGFIRGQAAPMRYDPQVGDIVCRRRGFLIFCWAAVAVIDVTLLNGPGLHDPAWRIGLPAALTFLTTSFAASTLTIFSRMSGMLRDNRIQSQQEVQAQ